MKDVYAIVTERVVDLLKKGTVPWQQPWAGANQLPRNLVSRKPYRGVNPFLLMSAGYASPHWLTFKQAQELGGSVRRGEKACPVVFWKWLDVEDPETKQPKRVPFLRYFSVFNSAQCDGIDAHIPAGDSPQRAHNPIDEAERIVAGMPRKPEVKLGQSRAFYSPAADFVGMPSPESFRSPADFYSVMFHELTHSTGHESRLNRKGVGGAEGEWSAFGSNAYAKEELVAEMGAAFLCGHAGIVDRTIENSAAYVASWISRLQEDPKLVVHAAAAAQKAADFVSGISVSHGQEGEVVQ